WIYNCVHQNDLGGTAPGSMAPAAQSVYDEALSVPPMKLVERDVIRDDVLDMWTRRSRNPEICSLEVKAQLAGVNFARRRLLDIVERYGPATVKRAMNRAIEDTAASVSRRLRALPDGRWRDERYLAGASSTDRELRKLCLTFEKRGDRLRIANDGTSDAIGMLNFTVGALRGVVLDGLFHVLGFDANLCGAGVLRQLD